MEKKTITSPLCPFYLVGLAGFIFFLEVLDWAIRIHKFYSTTSGFQSFLQSQLDLVCGTNNSNTQSEEKKKPNPELNKQLSFQIDDGKLCRGEVEMVMEKLGISCDPNGEKLEEKLGFQELSRLFEEKDPTSEELTDAFEVFDENRDGYIDAEELQRVLCALGFLEGSKPRDCNKMIGAFDTNGDGRIDFTEFVKFMEMSFC
ncbi:probable calcium-binding protein CML46 [Macadamia integrifolia]|uniref:probable calcium-binding protein CML46 n=1 Tax=Macadamia integrifolia TaxID=60698 RepID=UPI001C4FF6F3|nr:probable calcium-binding protein CML46 [Macadamia integrifolia]